MPDPKLQLRDVDGLVPDPRNARTHSASQVEQLAGLIDRFGFSDPILADKLIRAGHGRQQAVQLIYSRGGLVYMVPGKERGGQVLPKGKVPVIDTTGWTDEECRAFNLGHNRVQEAGGWNQGALLEQLNELAAADFGLDVIGWDDSDLKALAARDEQKARAGNMSATFLVPPFTVLDARSGWWRDRKQQWLARGIKSELGRGDAPGSTLMPAGDLPSKAGDLVSDPKAKAKRKGRVGAATSYASQETLNGIMGNRKGLGATPTALGGAAPDADGMTTGTSVFDPVLCELAYRWFCPPAGLVLDPFAGGSVRGLVAAWLGRSYVGQDLSDRQLQANREQAEALLGDIPHPVWVHGDSRDLTASLTAAGQTAQADMVFTCPPYADLEIYSDDPADLSNMPYADFVAGYREVLRQAVDRLAPDRFAVLVVGEVRDPAGIYRNFVGDTVQAMVDAGAGYYNEAILMTPVGSLPIRAGRQFAAGRKMGKTHQNVLVFVKGDPAKAAQACGTVDVSDAMQAAGPGIDSDGGFEVAL
jgi:hypothetical protein